MPGLIWEFLPACWLVGTIVSLHSPGDRGPTWHVVLSVTPQTILWMPSTHTFSSMLVSLLTARPHTVLLLCWPWLSTCPLAAAAGPGSRYPPHISLTVRPEQVVAVLSWGSAGCYVWLFTVTDDDDITLPVLTRDQSAQSVLSSALLCFTRTCFLHFEAACESHASSSSGGDHWRAAVRPSQHSPCSLLGSAATWNRYNLIISDVHSVTQCLVCRCARPAWLQPTDCPHLAAPRPAQLGAGRRAAPRTCTVLHCTGETGIAPHHLYCVLCSTGGIRIQGINLWTLREMEIVLGHPSSYGHTQHKDST